MAKHELDPALIGWVEQQWRDILGVNEVGPEDSFFDLGGDSLAALQIVARLRQHNIHVEVMDVFENASCAELAGFLSKVAGLEPGRQAPVAATQTAEPQLPELTPDPAQRHEPFALTDMQESYWMGHTGLLELGRVAGHNYREYECHCPVARLEAAWRKLVARHDMLRAVILPDGRQRILADVPAYEIAHKDLSGLPAKEAEACLLAAREDMTAASRPLDRWPLFDIRAFTLPGQKVRVCMRFEFVIYDAQTQRLLLDEWATLCESPEAQLAPVQVSFRDYVLAMERFKDHELYQRSRQYWLDRLPSFPSKPSLPMQYQQIDRPTMRPLRGTIRLDRWLRLGNVAAKAGLTVSTVLAATFAEALGTWSKDPRFLMSMMVVDRLPMHEHVNKIVGNFTSTVPIAVDLGAGDRFVDRALAFQGQLSSALTHRYFPGAEVLKELNRLRSSPMAATSPYVFVSTIGLDRKFARTSTFWKYVHASLATPQVLVDMRASEHGGVPVFRCEYLDEYFPRGVVDDLFACYLETLERLADDDAAWSSKRAALVPGQHLEARQAANATAADVPDVLLHQPFFDQVPQRPDAPAVISGTTTLTYQQLCDRVSTLSARLRELGAGPGKLVAIVMDKCAEQVVATLATLAAGAAYVPINPGLPAARRRYLLEQCETHIVVVQKESQDDDFAWPASVAHVVSPSDDAPVTGAPVPPAGCTIEKLAYIIFTSGSTGMPKGVMMSHRGAVNTLLDINRRFEIGPGSRVLALSALDFDLAVYDIFGMLGAGGTVIMPSPELQKDPAHWLALLDEHQVTVWNSVPALLELLVEYATSTNTPFPQSLQTVLLSGDWIPVGLPARLRELLPDVNIISLGGATEAAVWSIYFPIGHVDPAWVSIPYGKPLANQRFYVLDDGLEDRPVFVTGELYIGGLGVAEGYWRDEKQTRERFIVHPRTGERLYRTGDLGRYLADGNIEFLGRADSQVKVQGYRIELGEIEAVLSAHPAIKLAYATTREGDRDRAASRRRRSREGSWGAARASSYKRLIAYVVPERGATIEEQTLREFIAGKLPEYMVPHRIVVIDQLPLSANGKVDRRALPEPGEQAVGRLPQTDVERELAAIWAKLLRIDAVDVTQDFFDAGGDSVLAVQLFIAIQRTWQRQLPVTALFTHPTIEAIAQLLGEKPVASQPYLVPLATDGKRSPCFLVHPVGGNVLCYAELTRRLSGLGLPFYGLQAPGPESGVDIDSVEQLAAAYLEDVRQVRPQGPYLLGGWSMGGVVAFEMARQLQCQGERVERLLLIDAPAHSEVDGHSDPYYLNWFARDLLQGRAFGSDLAITSMPDLIEAMETAGVKLDMEPANLERLFTIFRTNARALARYHRRSLKGDAWLLRAGSSHIDTSGWDTLVDGRFESVTIDANHYTLLREPALSEMVRHLEQIIG